MILHADLPEDLTAIPAGHGELQRVVVSVLLEDEKADLSMDAGKNILCEGKVSVTWTYSGVCAQLNEKPFAFEAELANLGPVEGINFCVPLEEKQRRIHHKKLINNQEKLITLQGKRQRKKENVYYTFTLKNIQFQLDLV